MATASTPNYETRSVDDAAFYKAQYEQLEAELREFQASSRELELELERDVEASEKREKKLRDQVEELSSELADWKMKYKQSKIEGGSAQQTLQKEVTALRDANRTLQLRLRDVEVVNDDFERQARFASSSLEDMEARCGMALERATMLEQEARETDREREELRVEAQRLREELSDVKVDAEITQSRLEKAEASMRETASKTDIHEGEARILELTPPRSDISMSTSADQATRSNASVAADTGTAPPSPAMSEILAIMKRSASDGTPTKEGGNGTQHEERAPQTGYFNSTRRPSYNGRETRKPSFRRPSGFKMRLSGVPQDGPRRTESLHQIRGLIGKMQRLEERVQSARSKLPAGTVRDSGRPEATGDAVTPSSVTMRSLKKSGSGRPSNTVKQRCGGGSDEDGLNDVSGANPDTVGSSSSKNENVEDLVAARKVGYDDHQVPHVEVSTSVSPIKSRPSSGDTEQAKPDTPRPTRQAIRLTTLPMAKQDITVFGPRSRASRAPEELAAGRSAAYGMLPPTMLVRKPDAPRAASTSRPSLSAKSSLASLGGSSFSQSRGSGSSSLALARASEQQQAGSPSTPTPRPLSRAQGTALSGIARSGRTTSGASGAARRTSSGAPTSRSYMAPTTSQAQKIKEMSTAGGICAPQTQWQVLPSAPEQQLCWDLGETF